MLRGNSSKTSWTSRLSKNAAKQLRKLPRDRQEQVAQAIEEMQHDPLGGDTLYIKSGKFAGALRRRVGRYRVVFSLDSSNRAIEIAAILLRSEKTYR